MVDHLLRREPRTRPGEPERGDGHAVLVQQRHRDAPDADVRLLERDRPAARPDLGEVRAQRLRIRDRGAAEPLERASRHAPDLLLAEEGKQRFLRRARVQGKAAARLDGEPQRLRALHTLEADRTVALAVRDGEERRLVRFARQPAQHGERGLAQIEHRAGAVAEVQRGRPEAEAPRPLVAREVPAARQRREDPVRRRHRQPRRTRDLARAPLRPLGAEQVEDRKGAVEGLERRCAVLHRRVAQSLITTMRSSVMSRTV